MIQLPHNCINKERLYLLLLERRALLIDEILEKSNATDRSKIFIERTEEGGVKFGYFGSYSGREYANYAIDTSNLGIRGLTISLQGQVLIERFALECLTFQDLVNYGVIDETRLVYVMTYDASPEYSYHCNDELVGVYDSFNALINQFAIFDASGEYHRYSDLSLIHIEAIQLNTLSQSLQDRD